MSDHTKSTYERSLNILRTALAVPEGIEFLQDSKKVNDWISTSKYATNSRKVFYIAIVSTLKKAGVYPEALIAYKAKMDELNKTVADKAEEQALTPEESEKFVEWPEVLSAVAKLEADVSDVASLQDYLIASLYTLIRPVRLDYADMKVADAEPENPDCNYLILSKKPYFLLTQYKTAKKWGADRIPIPKKLLEIIEEWRTMIDSEYFLVSPISNQPMPPWELGKTITRVFKKHLGKDVGVNVIRHSYATWMRRGEMSIKDSKELARSMHHSVGMSHLYRRI
jgi:integrase